MYAKISRSSYPGQWMFRSFEVSENKKQEVQHLLSFLRFLTGSCKRDHFNPALTSLHWLPRVHFKVFVI